MKKANARSKERSYRRPAPQKGTVTGKDGRAVITVPEGSELKISYIGYEPRTIAVNDENPVAVSLIRNPEAGFTPPTTCPTRRRSNNRSR